QMGLADYSRYTRGGALPAPAPAEVLTQQGEPITLFTPGSTQPQYGTKGMVQQRPLYYTAPNKEGANTTTPTPATLPENATWDAEQALRRRFNLAGGFDPASGGFLLDPKTMQSAWTLPPGIEKMMPDLLSKISTYASNNHLNWEAAADQVIGETFGTIRGDRGFRVDTSRLGPDTYTPGAQK